LILLNKIPCAGGNVLNEAKKEDAKRGNGREASGACRSLSQFFVGDTFLGDEHDQSESV
jgi:hypothetical protein